MKDKLRAYLDHIFADAPKTRRAYELEEEIMANLLDKYNDLVAQGKSEEEAYRAAIASIGNIEEIVAELERESQPVSSAAVETAQKRSAVLTAVAVMLYIIGPAFVILFGEVFRNETIGILIMFACCAVATGLLIFKSMTKPKYLRRDDTVVEEFKEFKSQKDHHYHRRSGFGQIAAAVWSVALVAYFIVSFATQAWYITWVIFLIALAVQNIIKAVMDLRLYGRSNNGEGR